MTGHSLTRVAFGTGYDPKASVREMAGWMREAEERGYELGFFSETISLMRDSVTALAAFGLATTRLLLGSTQIVRLRTPVLMAQTLASLDELTGGRIVLAPGACTRTHALRHGLEPVDPALTLQEWVEAIRLLLRGETTSFHGQTVHFDNVQLSWKPLRRHIPLWIAATSRTGLRLAAKIGDGVILNAATSPDYTANAIKILRQAVEEVGRDWAQFEVAQIIVCSVDDDRGKALEAVRWEVASKFEPAQVAFNAGPRLRVGEPYIREEDLPVFAEAYRKGGKEALMQALPESYIEGLTASGTPREVIQRVQQYCAAGVRLPILRPAAPGQARRLLDLFAVR